MYIRDFQRKEEIVVVALDLKETYNSGLHDTVDVDAGMWPRPLVVRWIASMLLKKTVVLKYRSWTSEHRNITTGLLQGSKMSHIFFNICIQQEL